MFLSKTKGIIDYVGLPQAVEQNSKLPGDTNDGSIFGVLAAAFCELQAPKTRVAALVPRMIIGSRGPQDVVGGAYQSIGAGRRCRSW